VLLVAEYALGVKSIGFKAQAALQEKYSQVKSRVYLGACSHKNSTTIRYAFENAGSKRLHAKKEHVVCLKCETLTYPKLHAHSA
jgi:hypothetical protein